MPSSLPTICNLHIWRAFPGSNKRTPMTGARPPVHPIHRLSDAVMDGKPSHPRRQAPLVPLEEASDETLLGMRLCDLPVRLEGSLMARRMERLHRELQARDIASLPHAWLSEEFFSPDGVFGFAIPFYLV